MVPGSFGRGRNQYNLRIDSTKYGNWRCCCLIIAMLVGVGCSGNEQQPPPDRASVSGQVTFDGEPLPGGVIKFMLIDEPSKTTSATIDEGTYSTERAPIGECWVSIATETIQYGNPAAYVPIPPRYGTPDKSGLTADLAAGENPDVDFALEK